MTIYCLLVGIKTLNPHILTNVLKLPQSLRVGSCQDTRKNFSKCISKSRRQKPLPGAGNKQFKSRRCKNAGQPATDAWSHIKLI